MPAMRVPFASLFGDPAKTRPSAIAITAAKPASMARRVQKRVREEDREARRAEDAATRRAMVAPRC